MQTSTKEKNAYIVTGPTSGIGRAAALELAKYGTVVLVGRDPGRLDQVQKRIEKKGQDAVSVVCDLSDISSVRRAAAEIIALQLLIAGVLNNAGIMQMSPAKNAQGWDVTFATNHLGPFALTEALSPYLPDGTHVVFVVSGTEDPERPSAKRTGFRGGRYLSARDSAQGNWKPGGSENPGFDAYATSKQAILAAALALARENTRLQFNAIEPGINVSTGLARNAPPVRRLLAKYLAPLLVPLFLPFVDVLNTPKRAAQVIARILTDPSVRTGVYYDQNGKPKLASPVARNPEFQDRVVAETRILLATVPA
jgi:NAD(P)-dependent dehydrogenase (short-subunit alcohol dehydrogenase family)